MEIRIVDYDPTMQPAINSMMDGIQTEFEIPISGPASAHLDQYYRKPGYRFWVATRGNDLAGTIGVKLFGKEFAEIKRMMVDQRFRGPLYKTATKLMQTALQHAREQGCSKVYLGTMEQFEAAQRFYAKYGFEPVDPAFLPAEYVINPIDKLFYVLPL